MLARVGLIVCVGVFLTCASPVPQENNDPDLSIVGRTTLPPDEINEQATELNTEDPLANADQASDRSEAADSGNGRETESNTEINETANNNEGGETESELENSKSNEGSESVAGTNEPPIGEDSDSKSEGNENDPGNAHEDPVHGSDEEDSEYDDSYNDSDEHHDTDDQHEIDLNVIEINDFTLRVYKTSGYHKYNVCQEMKRHDKIIEKICYTSSPNPALYNFTPRELLSVFRQHSNGQDFICQDISSIISGSLQVLCASNKEHFFKQSFGLKKFIIYHKKSL